ncbi:hypothetical protein DF223_14985 [Mycetocola zhujimingii]|uniref:Uncharacterized protein n=1 Tax=Mycetocola zhujimingii TaxID=2079792 RepID=A0A2U1TAL7_9MICO|nr:hypothetical protein DF223_14985 [Mycetocola zhujimingii]
MLTGLGLLLTDAHVRLDAAERVIPLTAEERDYFGPDADVMIRSFVTSSLVQGLVSGSGVRTFEVTVSDPDSEGGEVSIIEHSSPKVVVFPGSWHAAPPAMPLFAGIVLLVVALFDRAARWRAQPDTER